MTFKFNKRKIFIFFPVLIFISFSINAQKIKKGIANRQFYKMNYAIAARHFEELLKKDPANTIYMEKLATCYRRMNQPEKSEIWYSRLVESKGASSENMVYYAQALAQNKKYDLAKQWYKNYADVVSNDGRGQKFMAAYDKLDAFFADSNRYKLKLAPFNSENADFSPAFYKNGVVFSSNRGKQVFLKRIFNWNSEPFLSLYYSNDSNGTSITKFSNKVNSKFHEGPCVFLGQNQEKMLFTRNNYLKMRAKKSKEGVNMLQLYWATDKGGKWTDITPFLYNNTEYSTGHPAWFAREKELYYVSDQPDRIGGTDIFMVKLKDDGSWTEPKNLGKNINTGGNEMFPFVDIEGNLYFASDGHPGLGGLDIFYAERQGNGFSEPVNIGFPVNSHRDDFGFIIDSTKRIGYFSSNRDGGKGGDDIYSFVRQPDPPVTLKLSFKDSLDKKLIDSVKVLITDTCKGMAKEFFTATDNTLKFRLNRKYGYMVDVTRNGYFPNDKKISYTRINSVKDTLYVSISLLPEIKCVTVTGNVKDQKTGKPLKDAAIHMKDPNGTISVLKTDVAGNYTICMEPYKDYIIKSTKLRYLSDCYTLRVDKPVREPHYVNKSMLLVPLKLNMTFKVENLLYDLGKWDIKPEAGIELDKVVAFLYENESIKIELGSHTDSRGSDKANMDLSKKRAQSAVDYIVSKGIAANRIVAKGYGESKPLNKCKNGVKCKEPEYAVNRRTEIKVIGFVNVIENFDEQHEKELFNAEKDKTDCEVVIPSVK